MKTDQKQVQEDNVAAIGIGAVDPEGGDGNTEAESEGTESEKSGEESEQGV